MAQFIRDVELPVCWASLDGSHRDPNKLLQDIVGSIHQRFPDFDMDLERQTLERPRSGTRWQENLPTVLNHIYTEIPEIFILILDDFHEAEANPEIIELMDTMLTHLPENLRVFLVSRSRPPLRSVPRLTAQREVVRLSQAQLRFSPGEVQEFFSSAYNREIDDAEARALVEGTRGWISAITLVAENAEPGLPIAITPEARDDLYGYLAHEVFSHQPEGLRRFLLSTCVLDQLDPEICDPLVGGREAERWLSYLREQGLFVSQTGGPAGAIQLHQLFREFLYDLMKREDPTALGEAHSRAGSTLEVRGRTLEAIDHFMKAQDFDRAATVLEGTAEYIFQHGEWHNLSAWIDSLPQHALDEHPALLVCRASMATDTGAPDTALQLCRRAEDVFRSSGDAVGTISAMLAKSVALRNKGLFDQAIDVARNALEEVPPPGHEIATRLNAETLKQVGLTLSQDGQLDESMAPLEQALRIYNIAILHSVLGINRGHEARYPEALFHLERARRCWTLMKNQKALAEVLNNIGMLHYLQGDLELAEETLRKGINEARQSHKPGAHAYCLASLAEVKRDGGDLAQSLLLYDEALEEARAGQMAPLIPYLTDGMSTLYRLVGQLDKAETLARQNVHPDKKLGSVEEGLYKRSLSAVLCEKGRHAEASRLLMESSELLRATDVPQELAKAEFLLAHLAQRAGRTEACTAHLREVAVLLDRVQRYTFLLAEASGKQELVQYAISQGTGEVWFYPLLQGSRQVRLILGEGAEGESRHSLSRVDGYSMGACKVVLDGNEIPRKAWKTKKAVQLLFLSPMNVGSSARKRSWRRSGRIVLPRRRIAPSSPLCTAYEEPCIRTP